MSRSDRGMKRLAYLQSILDCTQDALFVTEAAPKSGASGTICYVNDAFTKLTGYSLADAIGRPPTFQCGPDPDRLTTERLESAFRRTEKSHLTLRSYRKDGSGFTCDYFITPLIENGECTYVIAIQQPVAGTTVDTAKREEQARSLADAVTEAILVHHDKQPLFVNKAYVALFGYASRAEAMREISPLMNLPLAPGAAGQACRCDALRTDGLPLSLMVRSQPICWEGTPATLLTISRDTRSNGKKTASARAARARPGPDEAALMRELLDSLPVIVAHKTPDLRYTYVNKTYADWVDSTREEIIGSHVSNLRNESHYQMMKPRREAVLSGKVVTYNSTCEFPGRGMCDLLTTLIPQRDADGRVIGYFSMVQDITELKETERALARREEQLRLVMDSVPALISYRDRNLRYHYVNQPYADWYGVPREDMIGRHMTELVELSAIRELKSYFDRVLAGERFRQTFRYDRAEKNGRALVVDYVPHEDENGHIAGFFALGQELPVDDRRVTSETDSTNLRFVPLL